jgi:uracil-DNA glycosylase
VTISKLRGDILDLPAGGRGVVTIHPSWLLRMDDEAQKEAEYDRFVADLRLARKALRGR